MSALPVARVAPLELEGRSWPLSFPRWALRLRDDGEVKRYLFAGDPDFARVRPPWRYVEQMGAAHRLETDGVWLTIITRRRGPLFTEAKLRIEAAVPYDPDREPRMGSPRS